MSDVSGYYKDPVQPQSQPVPPDHTEAAHARGYREGVRNEQARWAAEREALVAVAQAAQVFVDSTDTAPIPLAPFQAIPWDDLCAALGRLNQETA